MGEVWVVNASPIISLAKVGRLNPLEHADRRVVVPAEVVEEVLAGPTGDPARRALEGGWGERTAAVVVLPNILEWGLGLGESAVLTVASREGGVAVVDDGQARRCARVLAVRVLGTLGIVIRAKQEGRIDSAAETLRSLVAAGFRLDDAVVGRVLQETVDEEWNIGRTT